jgi:hypothetical protein
MPSGSVCHPERSEAQRGIFRDIIVASRATRASQKVPLSLRSSGQALALLGRQYSGFRVRLRRARRAPAFSVDVPNEWRIGGFGTRSIYVVRKGADDLQYLQQYPP